MRRQERKTLSSNPGFLLRLRGGGRKPVALLLALLFILVSSGSVFAELQHDQNTDRPFQTEYASCDDLQEVAALPVESREYSENRERVQALSIIYDEIRFCRRQADLILVVHSSSRLLHPHIASLYKDFLRNAPFSSRPPPVLA